MGLEEVLLVIVGIVLGLSVLSWVMGLAFYLIQKLWVFILIGWILSYNFGEHAELWLVFGIISFVLDMLNR